MRDERKMRVEREMDAHELLRISQRHDTYLSGRIVFVAYSAHVVRISGRSGENFCIDHGVKHLRFRSRMIISIVAREQ